MKKSEMNIQEKQFLLNKIVGELNKNLSLIDEFEDINAEKIFKIEKLRREILIENPNFKDDYEIE